MIKTIYVQRNELEKPLLEILDAAWFGRNLNDRSATGIALGMRALIRSGLLPVGTKLPPVRDIATELKVSPATVASAWTTLRKQRILDGNRRNGTRVQRGQTFSMPTRFASYGVYTADVLDLRWARPDTTLLPSLEAALVHGAQVDKLNSYVREPILPELEDAVRKSWPYESEGFLATNSGYSAINILLHCLSLGGTRVALEYPAAARHFDLLENIGAHVVPVVCDQYGPLPTSLADALKQQPTALLMQPRLHSVTGQTITRERLAHLARVLGGSDTMIIEDDGMADLSSSPSQSLGSFLPNQVIHVRSFSKTHGPDLRLAVLSAPKAVIEQAQSYRSFGSGWTSRILQGAGAWLLRDKATNEAIGVARDLYGQRRAKLVDALNAEGVMALDGSGLCAWVPVKSEQFATVTLAAHGITATAGEHFGFVPLNHFRIATSTLSEERVEEVARVLGLAARDPMAAEHRSSL